MPSKVPAHFNPIIGEDPWAQEVLIEKADQKSVSVRLENGGVNIHIPKPLVSGIATGFFCSLATNPLAVYSTRQALGTQNTPYSWHAGLKYRMGNSVVGYGLHRTLENLFSQIIPEENRKSFLASMGSNAAASVIQTICGSPLAYVTIKAQTNPSLSLAQIYKEIPDGKKLQTVFSGLGISMVKNAGWSALFYPMTDEGKKYIPQDWKDNHPIWTKAANVMVGTTAAGLTSVVVYPLETISKLIKSTAAERSKPMSLKEAAYTLLSKSGGARNFYGGYLGVMPNMLISGAVTALVTGAIDDLFAAKDKDSPQNK